MLDPTDEELLSAYLDGEVTAAEQQRVESLLAEDAAYRQLHDELRALRQRLESLPTYRLPSDFGDSVLAAAEREMVTPYRDDADLEPQQSFAQRWLRPLIWSGLSVAVALMLMIFAPQEPKRGGVARNEAPQKPAAKGELTRANEKPAGPHDLELNAPREDRKPGNGEARMAANRADENADNFVATAPAGPDAPKSAAAFGNKSGAAPPAKPNGGLTATNGLAPQGAPANEAAAAKEQAAQSQAAQLQTGAAPAPAAPAPLLAPATPPAQLGPEVARTLDQTRQQRGPGAGGQGPARGAIAGAGPADDIPADGKVATKSEAKDQAADKLAKNDRTSHSLGDTQLGTVARRGGEPPIELMVSVTSTDDTGGSAFERLLADADTPGAKKYNIHRLQARLRESEAHEQQAAQSAGKSSADAKQAKSREEAPAPADVGGAVGGQKDGPSASKPSLADDARSSSSVASMYEVDLTYDELVALLAKIKARPGQFRLGPLGPKLDQDIAHQVAVANSREAANSYADSDKRKSAVAASPRAPASTPSPATTPPPAAKAAPREYSKKGAPPTADTDPSAGERDGGKLKGADGLFPGQSQEGKAAAPQSEPLAEKGQANAARQPEATSAGSYRVRFVVRIEPGQSAPAAAKEKQ